MHTIGLKMKFPSWINVVGDLSYRNKSCPSEAAEQVTIFNYLRKNYGDSYGLIAVHPRNEGKRSYQQTSKQKSEGMTKGASDIIIPANGGLVCELKRQDHTMCKWQDGQVEYLEACHKLGAHVFIALGAKAFIEEFEKWRS